MAVVGDVMVEGVEVALLVSNLYTELSSLNPFTKCFTYKSKTNSKYLRYLMIIIFIGLPDFL